MPGDDHAARAGEQHAAGLLELAAQAVDEGGDRPSFDPERLPSHLDQSLAVGGVVHRVRAASGCGAASYTGPPAALRMTPCRRRTSPSTSRPRSRARRSRVASDDDVHFAALVVATQFAGLRPLQRHQLVYRALGDAMGGDIHALSLDTPTPEEWARRAGLTASRHGQVPDPAAAAGSRARCAPRARRTRRCRSSPRACLPTRRSRSAMSRSLHDVKTMIRLLGRMGVAVDGGRGRHACGSTPRGSAKRSRPTNSSRPCAHRSWCSGRCWRATARRASPCPAAARSARVR